MAKLRDEIEQNLPFISVINYGDEEFVGIIINQDQYVTSFYDLNALRTPEEKTKFLEIGEIWCGNQIVNFLSMYFAKTIYTRLPMLSKHSTAKIPV